MNNTDKVDVIIKGMTLIQAMTFASWYEGQGEQDQCEWFDIHDVPAPMTQGGIDLIDNTVVIRVE